jgi:hypothetical protein
MAIAHPKTNEPVAIAGFFDYGPAKDGFPGLLNMERAIRTSRVTAQALLYIGHYGPNPDAARVLHRAGAQYAPMFSIQPGDPRRRGYPSVYYRERSAGDALSDDQLRELPAPYAGRIPVATPGKPLPRRNHLEWGIELGRRYRDRLRHARDGGMEIAGWQFDENLLELEVGVPASQQVLYRRFITGILRGVFGGRKELNDEDEQGIVWHALQRKPLRSKPLPLLHATKTPGVSEFWEALDQASWRVVGEEYTRFEAKAEAAAVDWASFQQLLQRRPPLGGDIRRSIGKKYVVGMSPGYHWDVRRLGGRVYSSWTRKRVNDWRNHFVRVRATAAPPSGFAQFNFLSGNAKYERMLDAFRAVELGLRVMA